MAYDEVTAARVRRALAHRSDVAEKKMMGGLVFMVGGHMCCGIKDQRLMIRVGADAPQTILSEPHVRPMEIAGRRTRGFVTVDRPGYSADRALAAWLQRALDFVGTLPARTPA